MGYYEKTPPDETRSIETTPRVADAWYNEVEDYDFDNPGNVPEGKQVGHFTAMVWRDTCEVGCGVSENFLVCRYAPPGNTLLLGGYDLYLENVCPEGVKCY